MTVLSDSASPRRFGLSVAPRRVPAAGAEMQTCVGEESARGYRHEINPKAEQTLTQDVQRGQSRNSRRAKPSGENRELHGGGHAYQVPSPRVVGVRQAGRDPYYSGQSQTRQWPLESLVAYRTA